MQRPGVPPYRAPEEQTLAANVLAERFDPAELRAVAQALREYERRCEEVLRLLADRRQLAPDERERVQSLYSALKADLRNAARRGTLSGERRPMSRAERRFYGRAVRRAAIGLRPATNSHPIRSRWFGAVQEALTELSDWRRHLESLLRDT